MPPLLAGVLNAFFSVMLGLFLAFPKVAESRIARKLIKTLFGRILAARYCKVIEAYGADYGTALQKGLDAAETLVQRPIKIIVDCGTGTGFASTVLASRYPRAHIVAIDAVTAMLLQARCNFRRGGIAAMVVCADTSRMPLPNVSADLVVAQNTMPFLREFARVCAPGGAVVFADSSARLVTSVAAKAMTKTGMFSITRAEAVASGFFLAGQRASSDITSTDDVTI